MTINEYINGIPEDIVSSDGVTLRDIMMDIVSIWSNNACRGYLIRAMKEAGYGREQIEDVLSKLRWAFDEVPIKDAERIYL